MDPFSEKTVQNLYKKIIQTPDLALIFHLNENGFVYRHSDLKKKILSDFFLKNESLVDKLRQAHWNQNKIFQSQLNLIVKNFIKNSCIKNSNSNGIVFKEMISKNFNIDKNLFFDTIKQL